MKYTRLGNTGLIVSRLALGTMTFGVDPSLPAIFKVKKEEAQDILARALDAGVNFLDTADMYASGQSEAILGELLGKRRTMW